MFCSTVIPTIGREKLNRAVHSMLSQNFPNDQYEVIVVNDSGEPLTGQSWQQSDQVTIINTNQRERCFARNSGASIARGRFLHFLDDDDWMESTFLSDLYASYKDDQEEVFFYASTKLIDRDGSPLIQLEHNMHGNCFAQVMAGEWFPLQSSLVQADAFFQAGGFNPFVVGGEDIDFLRRLALFGNFAQVSAVGSNLEMGVDQSSTDYNRVPELMRLCREEILNEKDAFKRLQDSATNVGWRGRVLRIYLTSMVWNLKFGRFSVAVSRAMFALTAFLSSFPMNFQIQYWKEVRKPYESQTFLDGFEEANIPVSRR